MNTRRPIPMNLSAGERPLTASARVGQASHPPNPRREGSRCQPLPEHTVLTSCRAWLGALLGGLALNAADAPAPAPGTHEIHLTNGPSPLAAERTQANPAPEPASPPRSASPELGRPVRPDYASFKIVTDRNIFNANRSGGTVRPSRDTRNPAKVEAFRLVGIMGYEKGLFAFFDGTSSDYRKALQAAGEIAGYTLTDVTADCVTLAADGKNYELHVGAQVRREDNGDWQMVTTGELPAGSGDGAASSEDSAGDDSGGELSEVLQKLMQQREQE